MPTRRRAASMRLSNGPTVPRTALSAVREPLYYALHFSPRGLFFKKRKNICNFQPPALHFDFSFRYNNNKCQGRDWWTPFFEVVYVLFTLYVEFQT